MLNIPVGLHHSELALSDFVTSYYAAFQSDRRQSRELTLSEGSLQELEISIIYIVVYGETTFEWLNRVLGTARRAVANFQGHIQAVKPYKGV